MSLPPDATPAYGDMGRAGGFPERLTAAERADLAGRISESLEGLEDWQLAAAFRATRSLQPTMGYGVPPFVLGFPLMGLEDGKVVGELEVTAIHLNPLMVAHGMIGFGLLDNAMGQAVAMKAGAPCAAVELKVQYLKPILRGATRVEGEAVHVGRKVVAALGRVYNSRGELACLATGTYYLISRTRLDGG